MLFNRSRNLLDCHIAGFTYHDGLDVIQQLKPGVPIALKSEADNPHDPNAVAVYFGDTMLGYIPKVKNYKISQLLYFGYEDIFDAKISCHYPDADPENQFRIVVKIKDNRN